MSLVRPKQSAYTVKSFSSENSCPLSAMLSGIGQLTPGIFRFGYAGGGPYRYMLTNHGGGEESGIPSACLRFGDILPGL